MTDILKHMGQNYQDGKYALMCHFLLVFMVTWSQNEPSEGRKKYPIDKYTKESNDMGKWAKFNTNNN